MRLFKIILSGLMIMLISGLGFSMNVAEGAVSGNWDLPVCVPPDGDIDICIDIDVDEANVPNGLIVKEYIPPDWTVNNCSPDYSSFDPSTGEIRWLFYGSGVVDMSICCNVHVPATETIGTVRSFSGEILYNDPSGNPVTVQVGGNNEVDICNPPMGCDENQDWVIGDFELLDLIDFWSAGSYCWDPVSGQYKPGAHDEYGVCR